MPNQVLLYYKYVQVADPGTERETQLELCQELGLKGRILIGQEGINGTVAGSIAATSAYVDAMSRHELFAGIDFKTSQCELIPFPRLQIKVRPEIVSLGVNVDLADSGVHLTPQQFNDFILDPDVVIFDARNRYESAIGRFEGAITPDIELFKELPAIVDSYADLKNRSVVMYCTGGIRCEKASALLKAEGFKNVYQLDGGIVKYAQEFPDGAFKGRCFVFDERMSVAFKDEPELLGACLHCSAPTSDYYNCAFMPCNELMLVCPDCLKLTDACGSACAAKLEAQIA